MIVEILFWWLLAGLIGCVIGSISDSVFFGNILRTSPLFHILMGPITLWVAIQSLIRGIISKIKGH